MEGWLFLILLLGAFGVAGWVVGLSRKARLYERNKPKIDSLDQDRRNFEKLKQQTLESFEQMRQRLAEERAQHERQIQLDKAAIIQLSEEKSLGFPWLASACADYFALLDEARAVSLIDKKRPAPRAAEEVRAIKREIVPLLCRRRRR